MQYVDLQNVEKNADKMEMPNSKRRRAVCQQGIFLTEQDRNVVDVLTTLTSFFHDVQ